MERLHCFEIAILAGIATMAVATTALGSDEEAKACRVATVYSGPAQILSQPGEFYYALFRDDCQGKFLAKCYRASKRCIDVTNRKDGEVCRVIGPKYSCIQSSAFIGNEDPVIQCLFNVDVSLEDTDIMSAAERCLVH